MTKENSVNKIIKSLMKEVFPHLTLNISDSFLLYTLHDSRMFQIRTMDCRPSVLHLVCAKMNQDREPTIFSSDLTISLYLKRNKEASYFKDSKERIRNSMNVGLE